MPTSDSLSATHPLYDARLRQWQQCSDCWKGQEAIKCRDNGWRYLPPTDGMRADGCGEQDCNSIGNLNYKSYLTRALFYGYYADAVTQALGLAWTKEPIFEGLEGTPLEYLIENATNEGESLARLLYRINEAQIGIGRIGIMADMPAGETRGKPQPYITTYDVYAVKNWDGGRVGEMNQETLNLVVLDESGPVRTGTFDWECQERYRVLTLGPADTNEASGVYKQGVFTVGKDDGTGTPAFDEALMIAPEVQGRKLSEIPFCFINSSTANSAPVDPPLLSLSDLVINLYQLEADHVQALHGTASPTPVTKGLKAQAPGEKALRIGAGAHIALSDSPNADAKFLELEGKSLSEFRQTIDGLRDICSHRAGEISDSGSKGRESGNALEQRISVRTSSLASVAVSGAHGLQRLLRIMGRWLGMEEADISKILVKPNLLFSKPVLSAIELKSLCESRLMGGAVLPLESIHAFLVARGFTTLSFSDTVALWESEKDLAKKLLPEIDLTKTGGPNGGPKIAPASTGF